MATDTWLGKAVLQREHPYHPAGLPNDDGGGSAAYDGSEFADAEPTFEVVLQARAERQAMVDAFLAAVTADTLAAVREAKEETSLDVTLTEQFFVYSDPRRDDRSRSRHPDDQVSWTWPVCVFQGWRQL